VVTGIVVFSCVFWLFVIVVYNCSVGGVYMNDSEVVLALKDIRGQSDF